MGKQSLSWTEWEERVIALEDKNTSLEKEILLRDYDTRRTDQGRIELIKEVIKEYPTYRRYEDRFKEEVRQMINKFVIERVKCEP